MYTQKFYHITFKFINMRYGLGRNVLEELLVLRFDLSYGAYCRGQKYTAKTMELEYPSVKTVFIYEDKSLPRDIGGRINNDRFLIYMISNK